MKYKEKGEVSPVSLWNIGFRTLSIEDGKTEIFNIMFRYRTDDVIMEDVLLSRST